MNEKLIRERAKQHTVDKHRGKHALAAFFSGGMLAIAAQALMELYASWLKVEEATAVSMSVVTIIFLTALFTGLGLYDKLAQHCGAGLFIPISGFANSLTSCAMEGRSEGFIFGIGGMMFKLAGSVLTYGIASAFFFGLLRFLLFGA